MSSRDRTLLRLHIEAVWGVQLPSIEQISLELLPESALPDWRLCAAELADEQIAIWRPGVTSEERVQLLTQLNKVRDLPATSILPAGISREVAFSLRNPIEPGLTPTSQVARLLTSLDQALLTEVFQNDAEELLQDDCHPLIGVIVDGQLLSLAHSSRRTAEACELGVDTLPVARHRGYALAVTRLWSKYVLQEGLTPLYSALAENIASLGLAAASGYQPFAHVTILV